MSFSSDVKQELCRLELSDEKQKYAQCYGLLLFASKFSHREIVFKTENVYTANMFEALITELFAPIIEKQSTLKIKNTNSSLYKFSVILPDSCKYIYENFGHNVKDLKLRINRANMDAAELYADFLRGVFLSCGSVTDPQKGYHLEFSVQHKTLAENLILLINEIEVLDVKPKLTQRKGGYVVYIKGNYAICDLLGYICAGNSVMVMIEASAYKEIRNKINRRRNSEIANIHKLASASARQINAIKKIINKGKFDELPDELKALANLRIENPEMSLKELGDTLTPNISRSGVNHRLQRLLDIAERI